MVICLESYSLLLSENKNASESQVTPKLPHRKEGRLWRNPNYTMFKDFPKGCWEFATTGKYVSWISCYDRRPAGYFRAIQKFKGWGPWNIKIPSIYAENPEVDFFSIIKVMTQIRKWSLIMVQRSPTSFFLNNFLGV